MTDATDTLENQLRRDSAERGEPTNWRLMYANAADALAAKDAEIERITRELAALGSREVRTAERLFEEEQSRIKASIEAATATARVVKTATHRR